MGYLATRNTVLSDEHWKIALESGNELSALRDYAFIGEVVRLILDTLAGKHYETAELDAELKHLLDRETLDGKCTYLAELQNGRIGVKIWRKARYLTVVKSPITFCLELITNFYPCAYKQFKGVFSIHNDEQLDLFTDALNTFLYHQRSQEMWDLDAAFEGTDRIVNVKPLPEVDDPKDAVYAKIRQLFTDGNSIDEICEVTGVSERKIYEVIKDLRVSEKRIKDMQLLARALKLKDQGMSKRAIADTLKMSRTKLTQILSL